MGGVVMKAAADKPHSVRGGGVVIVTNKAQKRLWSRRDVERHIWDDLAG